MWILGLSAFYHDSAVCLVKNGEIKAAIQEERLTRIKHDSCFPSRAIIECLSICNLHFSDIDFVIFYDKPYLKFERLLETYIAMAPRGVKSFAKSMPLWVKDKLFQKNLLLEELGNISNGIDWSDKLLFSEHHLSHAASAFYPSPFPEAAILTMDGVGEWATTSISVGSNEQIEVLKEINFPHSLGLLYSTFTQYAGFKVNSGEYKLMGLAPYGEPIYYDLIKEKLIHIFPDGSFKLNIEYFDFCTGLTMTNSKFHNLFNGPDRDPESPITKKDIDIAASIQKITEEIVLNLANHAAEVTGKKSLCIAGGVGLNCVANGKLISKNIFENIWVQPAAGDAGGAIGSALAAYHLHLKRPRIINSKIPDGMNGAYLGRDYSDNEISSILTDIGAVFEPLLPGKLAPTIAKKLSEGAAIGWFQGRMEFGPRALGSRSILADPRSHKTQDDLNLKIKFRESFRPFAPAILEEEASKWFDIQNASPYMLFVGEVKSKHRIEPPNTSPTKSGLEMLKNPRSTIPAVTHVDYSARIQTVSAKTNPLFHSLLKAFQEITECPILVNTSFNVRGEPIVNTPEDAYRCFMGTDLDYLVIGNHLLSKQNQPMTMRRSYINEFLAD